MVRVPFAMVEPVAFPVSEPVALVKTDTRASVPGASVVAEAAQVNVAIPARTAAMVRTV